MSILEINNLQVEFDTYGGTVHAVRGLDISVAKGKTLAVVGESGCGKSVSFQAIMGLLPMPPGRITSGSAKFMGQDLLKLKDREMRKLRGSQIAMIFQDPMSSLNPTKKIGAQIAESLIIHKGMSRKDALKESLHLLELTRIADAKKRLNQYPFEFSGGMLQRVMIAIAVACKPQLLIADEPTTALDVTIQDQILALLKDLQREYEMSLILITHDLGVVARMADEVAVMYAGQILEQGSVDDVFYRSAHPYTLGLKQALPHSQEGKSSKLIPIDGLPPDLFSPPKACSYVSRCPMASQVCKDKAPLIFEAEEKHFSRCWLQHPQAPPQPQLFCGDRT
ncbi:ABC transporter ATP-binding protein [Lentisphaera profundi]|uniref:ABC transporter ATP-binding protein n=1 Tax=Lentisphaera profundi TaxID=1658616 RepID=A0ABY7VUQ7_9BACT|nr:ABC transporter ATP-binding protein [Lentisphaera profundi]WDE96627.1 ABC transporter ATP-binding protein [Lentisphaera profundi]